MVARWGATTPNNEVMQVGGVQFQGWSQKHHWQVTTGRCTAPTRTSARQANQRMALAEAGRASSATCRKARDGTPCCQEERGCEICYSTQVHPGRPTPRSPNSLSRQSGRVSSRTSPRRRTRSTKLTKTSRTAPMHLQGRVHLGPTSSEWEQTPACIRSRSTAASFLDKNCGVTLLWRREQRDLLEFPCFGAIAPTTQTPWPTWAPATCKGCARS